MPYPRDMTLQEHMAANRRDTDRIGLTVPDKPYCLATEGEILSFAMTCAAENSSESRAALGYLLENLETSDFYSQANRDVWHQIQTITDAGGYADFLTVKEALLVRSSIHPRDVSTYMATLEDGQTSESGAWQR